MISPIPKCWSGLWRGAIFTNFVEKWSGNYQIKLSPYTPVGRENDKLAERH